jgi:hypothetical protein
MKKGDRVVCIDDSFGWASNIDTGLKKGEIYTIEKVFDGNCPSGINVTVFELGLFDLFCSSRFKKIEPTKHEFTNEVTKRLADLFTERDGCPEIEKPDRVFRTDAEF